MCRYRSNPFVQAFLAIGFAAIGGLSLNATRSHADPNTNGSDHPVLDKCPVTRIQYDNLRIGIPEYAIFDAMPCGKGEVVSESNIGFGRRIILLKVWRFPKDGGGSVVVVTTGGDVTNKRWE